MRQVVLYHAGCFDGFCAAWVAHQKMPAATFTPVNYGQPVPEIPDGSEVYILDFSYPRGVLQELRPRCSKIVVLDHHKTAKEELDGMSDPFNPDALRLDHALIVKFDMGKSGGRLAWEWFNPGSPSPWLVDYTEDRDLWRWKLPNSKEINAALRTLPVDFDCWDLLHRASNLHVMAVEGAAILRREKQVIDDHVRFAVPTTIGGHTVPCVNATLLSSEIAGELAKGQPFAAVWFQRADGKRIYSLRSDQNGLDVSAIAKAQGGGGHYHAAGFEV